MSKLEKLQAIPAIVQKVVESQADTRFDRANFVKFADSSLDFEVVYWSLTPDYRVTLNIQEKINLEILRRFGEVKIEFAYPTRTVRMQKE